MAGQSFTYSYDNMVILRQINTPQGPWNFVSDMQPYSGGNNGYNQIRIYDPVDTGQTAPMVIRYDNVVHGQSHYTQTDHRSKTTTFGVQSVGGIGVVNQITTPEGYTQNLTFDPADPYQPVTTQDQRTNSTLQYNAQGNLLRTVSRANGNPNISRSLSISYSSNGVDATSATAYATQNDLAFAQGLGSDSYNFNHQPMSALDPAGNRTDITYTAWGAPLVVTNYVGNTSTQQDQIRYYYGTDAGANLNRLVQVRVDTTLQASYTYDAAGRVASMTDARGLTVRYAYNNLDNVTSTVYPDNTTELVDYVCCSLPRQVTDRSGRNTYYGYDNLKRLTNVQDADGKTLAFGYDTEGNRISMQDASSVLTQWQYDGDGRVTRKTYANGTAEQWNYNGPDNLLASSVNARGQTTNYSYGPWRDLSYIDHPTTADVSLRRDGFGRLTSMTDGVGDSAWHYDTAGRLDAEGGPWGSDVGYSFNGRNDISQTRVASNTGTDVVNYGYDLIGRLNQVSAATGKWGAVAGARGGTWDTTFVGWSQMPLTQNQPNGMYNEWTYEGAGTLQRLTKVSNKISASSPVLSRFFYGYNAPGQGALDTRNVVSKQYGDNAGQIQSTNYSYNVTSMLNGESAAGQNAQTPPVSNSYQFDGMGNRTDWRDSVALKSGSSSYNTLNQLTQTNLYDLAPNSFAPTYTGTLNYGYDNDGNTTSSQLGASNTLYAYDEENRLTSITNTSNGQSSSKTEFVYDGMSRLRISRYYVNINGTLTQQNEKRRVYDGMNIVQERDQNNTVTASITRAGNIGGILARTTSTGSVFYGYDGNGNVTTLTNSAGAEVGSYTYDAFGKTVATSGSAASDNPYQFSTKEQIGGLYSYGFRFYSPGLGRWINRDPIGENGGINLYGFVGNDPVSSGGAYGLAQVEVRFKSLGVGNHAYIIVSDNGGENPYIIRFGGQGGSGGSSGSSSASGGSSSQSSGSRPYGSGGSSNNSSNSSNSSSAGSSRGGPGKNCGRWGPIEPFFGPYIPTQKNGSVTPDYTDGTDPSITIVAGDKMPASYYERLFRDKAMDIGSAMVPYNPVTTNSNAAVSSVLSRTGLGTKQTKTPVWAPGWSTNLPNK